MWLNRQSAAIISDMNRRDTIIYRTSLILIGLEILITSLSILLNPVSDAFLRTMGVLIIITAIPALYGFIVKYIVDRRK